jgi:hypothetical protein
MGTAVTAAAVKKSEPLITRALCGSDYLIKEQPEYWCMRRMVCISIVLVLILLTSGCIWGTGDQTVPQPPAPPGTGPESAYAGPEMEDRQHPLR